MTKQDRTIEELILKSVKSSASAIPEDLQSSVMKRVESQLRYTTWVDDCKLLGSRLAILVVVLVVTFASLSYQSNKLNQLTNSKASARMKAGNLKAGNWFRPARYDPVTRSAMQK